MSGISSVMRSFLPIGDDVEGSLRVPMGPHILVYGPCLNGVGYYAIPKPHTHQRVGIDRALAAVVGEPAGHFSTTPAS